MERDRNEAALLKNPTERDSKTFKTCTGGLKRSSSPAFGEGITL